VAVRCCWYIEIVIGIGIVLAIAGAVVAYRGVMVSAAASHGLGGVAGGISAGAVMGILVMLAGIGLVIVGRARRRREARFD
jgi:hypothetical protein